MSIMSRMCLIYGQSGGFKNVQLKTNKSFNSSTEVSSVCDEFVSCCWSVDSQGAEVWEWRQSNE